MKHLAMSVLNLIKHNKEGSFATHKNRQERLIQAMNELANLNYQIKDVRQLRSKHVTALVEYWKSKGLSAGTIKNRMSDLRWLAAKINKQNIVERSNSSYGIENRKYVDNYSNKSKTLSIGDLERLNNEFLKLSLKLQAEFGLRREESMKFQPKFADRETKIRLKASWCKGGREREIPITKQSQRDLLNEIHEFCRRNGTKSLIPADKKYVQQLKAYEYAMEKEGFLKNHGYRHAYAQQRYFELTGRLSPKQGGKTSRMLSESEKQLDLAARLQISQELGHNREEITAVYLGR